MLHNIDMGVNAYKYRHVHTMRLRQRRRYDIADYDFPLVRSPRHPVPQTADTAKLRADLVAIRCRTLQLAATANSNLFRA